MYLNCYLSGRRSQICPHEGSSLQYTIPRIFRHLERSVSSLELLIMLTYCVRNVLSRRPSILKTPQCSLTLFLQHTRKRCSTSPDENLDKVRTLVQLCVDRYYISPGQSNIELFQRGVSCTYGPLGLELRRNLLELWWHSVTRSSAQVFGINTLNSSKDTARDGRGQLRIVESEHFKEIFEQRELSKEQLIQKVQELLQRSPSVRTNLLQGRVLHLPDRLTV